MEDYPEIYKELSIKKLNEIINDITEESKQKPREFIFGWMTKEAMLKFDKAMKEEVEKYTYIK